MRSGERQVPTGGTCGRTACTVRTTESVSECTQYTVWIYDCGILDTCLRDGCFPVSQSHSVLTRRQREIRLVQAQTQRHRRHLTLRPRLSSRQGCASRANSRSSLPGLNPSRGTARHSRTKHPSVVRSIMSGAKRLRTDVTGGICPLPWVVLRST